MGFSTAGIAFFNLPNSLQKDVFHRLSGLHAFPSRFEIWAVDDWIFQTWFSSQVRSLS